MKTAHEAIAAIKAELERRLEELNPKQGEFAGRPLRAINPRTFPRESEIEKMLAFLDTLEAENAPSCRSCGFYENNCPFIRGKFIPYPSRVCKDYTYSAMKAGEKEVDLDGPTMAEEIRRLGPNPSEFDVARRFFELGKKCGL